MEKIADKNERARALWAAGDFDAIAELIWEVGGWVIDRVGVREGERVLDVACGTGNASIPAAVAGGDVTGLDLTPELFVAAREHAAQAGVDIDWVEGDAEELPFDDASFDVVVSTFGCMFAPHHERTAGEIARVLRSGGRACIASWTPDGTVGDFFKTVGSHMPPPPQPFTPPALWGNEEHVRSLFEPHGVTIECERQTVMMRSDSADALTTLYEEKFGPVVKAKELLEPQGKWEALRSDLVKLFETHNRSTDGRMAYPADYLVALGTRN
jgi:ubiquinone/menaquinone biosynthesis C-methylase UbiE